MHWLLRLYPREWRERYEEEMVAVLEQHHVTPATMLDLLLGALDANWNYNDFAEGVARMTNRLRSSVVMTFCAFMVFGVGWGLRQRLSDPLPLFNQAATLHPSLSVLFQAIFITGCVAFIAFMAGGLPLVFVAARRAWQQKNKSVLAPFGIALASLIVFILATVSLALWHPSHQGIVAVLLTYLALSAALLVLGTIMVALMMARTEFKLSELKWMYIPETIIVFCMVVSVGLSLALIIEMTTVAPDLFQTQDVGSTMFMTGIILMSIGAIFAILGLRRGASSWRHPLAEA